MKRFFPKNKKTRVLALSLSAALLITCLSIALAGTLAAPGDVTETFLIPYPDSYTRAVELGGTRTENVIDAFVWTSSDINICRVTRDSYNFTQAEVEGRDYGVCAITAGTRNGLISSRPFYVRERSNILSYTLTGGNVGYIENVSGGSTVIPFSATNFYGTSADLSKVTWVSLDPTVAIVDSSSRTVIAQGRSGYATIRGTCLDPWGVTHYILYRVAVGDVPNPLFTVTGVTVTPDPASVNAGGSQIFSASVQYTGTTAAPQTVTWELLGSAVSTITPTAGGGVTLNVPFTETAQTLTIRATSTADPKIYKNVTVTVGQSYTITGVTVSPVTANLRPGEFQQFIAQVSGTGTNIPTTVNWQVIGNASTGTAIDASGRLVVANNEISPYLIVRATSSIDPARFGDARVYLTPSVSGVTVIPNIVELSPGNSYQFAAIVLPSDAPQNVIWTLTGAVSTNTSISSTGLLTLGANETTGRTLTVTATHENDTTKYDTAQVNVTSSGGPITSMTVNPTSADVYKGSTQQYTVTILPATAPQGVIWTVSGATSTGTSINSAGLLTVAAGENATTLVVTATSNVYSNRSANATANIKDSGGGGGGDGLPGLEGTPIGGVITIDGIDWIRVRDGQNAQIGVKWSMLLMKGVLQPAQVFAKQFTMTKNGYENSDLRNFINGWYYYTNMPTLKQYALHCHIYGGDAESYTTGFPPSSTALNTNVAFCPKRSDVWNHLSVSQLENGYRWWTNTGVDTPNSYYLQYLVLNYDGSWSGRQYTTTDIYARPAIFVRR